MTTEPLWNKADIVTPFDIIKKFEGANLNLYLQTRIEGNILSVGLLRAIRECLANQASIYCPDNPFNLKQRPKRLQQEVHQKRKAKCWVYSRSSTPCDHSRKRPTLVTTTSVKPRLKLMKE